MQLYHRLKHDTASLIVPSEAVSCLRCNLVQVSTITLWRQALSQGLVSEHVHKTFNNIEVPLAQRVVIETTVHPPLFGTVFFPL